MCKSCEEHAAVVGPKFGIEPEKVMEILHAMREEHEKAESAANASVDQFLSEFLGREVRMELLGAKPFVMLTVKSAPEGGHAVFVEYGGGIGTPIVERVLSDALEGWRTMNAAKLN